MMQISSRERILAVFLMTTLAVWAVYSLALQPARDRIQTLQRIIPEKQAQLRDLRAKSVEYEALKRNRDLRRADLTVQDPDFQLLPFLEALVERHQLAKHATMGGRDPLQPQPERGEAVVTIELRGVSLTQIVEFLRDVDTPKAAVHIGSWQLRKAPNNEGQLDFNIEISSPKLSRPALASQSTP